MTEPGRRLIAVGAAALAIALSVVLWNRLESNRLAASMGAEAYYRWLMGCTYAMEKDLPGIIRSAEAAAKAHLDGGAIGIRGESSFYNEGLGRSGGLMSLASNRPDLRILLTALLDDRQYRAGGPATNRNSDGWIHIGFGTRRVLDRAVARGAPFDFVVETHALERNGLFRVGDGRRVVPTVPAANMLALWVWTGEFAAACTRMGKMPLMFQGYTFPGGAERAVRLAGPEIVKYSGPGSKNFFHEEQPEPVEPGVAGRAYLRELRGILRLVHGREMAAIRRAAAAAALARENGHDVYLVAEWHGHNNIGKRPCNLDCVVYGPQPNAGAGLFKKGDVVLTVAYAEVRRDYAAAARAAGAVFVSSFSSCLEGRGMKGRPGRESLRPDEIFIDQHWPFGDAVVQFPGYDIKILPPSGVVAEAVIEMFASELHMRCGAAGR